MSAAARRELLAGSIIILFGAAAVHEGWRLGVGTPAAMGPGFVPMALGVLLCLIGVGIACSGDEPDWADPTPRRFDRRGGVMILAGAVAFVVVGLRAGLVPATFLCVFLAALGDRVTTRRAALILALAVTTVGAVLFGLILKIPIPLVAGLLQ